MSEFRPKASIPLGRDSKSDPLAPRSPNLTSYIYLLRFMRDHLLYELPSTIEELQGNIRQGIHNNEESELNTDNVY